MRVPSANLRVPSANLRVPSTNLRIPRANFRVQGSSLKLIWRSRKPTCGIKKTIEGCQFEGPKSQLELIWGSREQPGGSQKPTSWSLESQESKWRIPRFKLRISRRGYVFFKVSVKCRGVTGTVIQYYSILLPSVLAKNVKWQKINFDDT